MPRSIGMCAKKYAVRARPGRCAGAAAVKARSARPSSPVPKYAHHRQAVRARPSTAAATSEPVTSWREALMPTAATDSPRSEEHTSELQSRRDLVCRLLLEKKKNDTYHYAHDEKKNMNTKSP